MGIVKLTNPPRDNEERKFRLWQFEGYWQVKLGTVHPHGLNDVNELKEWFQKFRIAKDRKMHKLNINHAQPLLLLLYLMYLILLHDQLIQTGYQEI